MNAPTERPRPRAAALEDLSGRFGWTRERIRLRLGGVASDAPVDLWNVAVGGEGPGLRLLAGSLNEEERSRADSLVRAADRRRARTARGAARFIMGGYLEVSPAVITFRRGRGGKPHLAGRFAGSALGFNYSHSGDRVLIAVAAGWEVGVDIEWVHSGLAIEEILESFLTRDERDAIDCLAGATRRERAFRIWARKEAVVKAVGAGLRLPMTAIEVGSAARAESRPIVVQASDRCRRRLVLSDVCCPPGYVAAAAVNTPREADASEQDVD